MFDKESLLNGTNLTPVAYYKHKTINRFTVGKFEFQNHLLTIYSDEDNNEFLDHVRGLLPVDQINIVEVQNIENEKPVTTAGGRVTRGNTSSRSSMQDLTAEARNADLQRREEELLSREAVIAARERELVPLVQGEIDPAPGGEDDVTRSTADSEVNPNSQTAASVAENDFKLHNPAGTTVAEASDNAGESTNQPDPAADAPETTDGGAQGDAFRVGGLKLGRTT